MIPLGTRWPLSAPPFAAKRDPTIRTNTRPLRLSLCGGLPLASASRMAPLIRFTP